MGITLGLASEEERDRRRAICNACDRKAVTAGVSWCRECRCAIKTKTSMQWSDCPIKRWNEE